MPERYVEAILKYLSSRQYQPLKPRQLARVMGVTDEHYGTFREAVKQLRDAGRVVLGTKNAVMLPEMSSRVVGHFRPNPRGFGFVTPETPTAHGDLFIPPDRTGGAMDGDLVVARPYQQGRKEGKTVFAGEIVEILERGQNRFVGTLEHAEKTWFVLPEGRRTLRPIVVRDVTAAGPKAGTNVIVEIVDYGTEKEFPAGVIVEVLGARGEIEVETLAVIRAHGLSDAFPPEVLEEAGRAARSFDPQDSKERSVREDLTDETIVTIDPPDARDFDDAISLTAASDGTMTLGVHIADVSHFVPPGGPLDIEARKRTTSVYFPRKVLPMIPEVLSNGACSLQEQQPRFCKSVFITYGGKGKIVSARVAETIIRSAKRLTYGEAQDLIDGKNHGSIRKVARLLKRMNTLAQAIEARRRKAGMLQLELPEANLVFDADDKVIDAVPEDDSYTHTIIEMFMVEANDAVANLLTAKKRSFLRRIHPPPDQTGSKQLSSFVRACGHKIPKDLTRKDMQELLAAAKGRPESYAINLAILKLLQQAEYSPMQVEHFALASRHYCHFTSPIRRYPDLTVHRLIRDYCRGRLDKLPPDDIGELTSLGEHCSTTERRAEAASRELREVLILQLLATRIGETFQGVITGVTNFGIFVEVPRFLVDGLIRLQDLGEDWWDLDARYGRIRGQRSGRTYRIGDVIPVRIVAVDVASRQMCLLPEKQKKRKEAAAGPPAGKAPKVAKANKRRKR
ncbi:MAG TPA: ribonuclease R [Phycisphaerae bacterium]|nr:ribonuclease R [Phycisphaerae bacterium]